ncbi:hypothetical protein FGG08_001001 [Glutinoglossum americanum]|uniref:Uncharacterized protein n=1 Tax=Glutinoglossum americanum TaxID=1670608 RepID=A0A9P8I2W0_9PEZI|nr:hypothetical protein FGG08_001001 [Glutinoglossum americanum]
MLHRVVQDLLPKTPSRTLRHSPHKKTYLTRDTNTTAFDPTERLEGQEMLIAQLQKSLNETDFKWGKAEESKAVYEAKSTSSVRALFQDILEYGAPSDSSNWRKLTHGFVCAVNELEAEKGQLRNELESAQRKHASTKNKLESQLAAERATNDNERRIAAEERRATEEDQRIQQAFIEDLMSEHRDEMERLENDYQQKLQSMQQRASEDANRLQGLNADGVRELERAKADLEREKSITKRLQETLTETSTTVLQLQATDRAKQAKIDYLESDGQAQAQSFADVLRQMQEAQDAEEAAKEKLRAEESVIRKLRNQVQELKGNIRVFCRVRPALGESEESARIALPDEGLDSKAIEVQGPEERSSLGTITTKTNAFTFDRVFGPSAHNQEVFEEISQLVQSALDGYNVCIFCYGQTGAGKTHTMSSEDGMIPRALRQIYDTARGIEEKGWRYTMEGSFVEVYNEVLNDLLGKPEDYEKTKHEIRHDAQTCKTTVTDLTAVVLDSPAKVESILKRATANRTVASTKANERSSRSHSVFILRLTGVNEITGEKSDGTLNLVDLAGSERLSHSGSTGDRLKETQNINKSLSCLGDVIGALGQGKEGGHVPYRNSKLTYLLRYSLGGNSKTLMFVMVSPLQAHLNETLTSLKFATKFGSLMGDISGDEVEGEAGGEWSRSGLLGGKRREEGPGTDVLRLSLGIPATTAAAAAAAAATTSIETPTSRFYNDSNSTNGHEASPPPLNTALAGEQDSITSSQCIALPQSPASGGLELRADIEPCCEVSPAAATFATAAQQQVVAARSSSSSSSSRRATSPHPHSSHYYPPPYSTAGPHRTPSVKAAISASTTLAGSLSPGSALSSPALGPMVDITPLPSPLISSDSPGPWNRIAMASRPGSRPGSRGSKGSKGSGLGVTSTLEEGEEQPQQKPRRKTYQGLAAKTAEGRDAGEVRHGRNRSQSEYVPEGLQPAGPRHISVLASGESTATASSSEAAPGAATPTVPHIKREPYLAIERGLTGITSVVVDGVPTPPPSHRGVESSDSDSSLSNTRSMQDRSEGRTTKKPRHDYYGAVMVKSGKRKRWRALYQLGQGTFSKVMLATSQEHIPEDSSYNSDNKIDEEENEEGRVPNPPSSSASAPTTTSPPGINPTTLVAVKILEHGPAGGASEERIESSLKRELDILKSIHHPSLVHLEAFSVERTRALLVLRYCDGGDLFELAASEWGRKEVLGVEMVRRIFAELVGAVRYLHGEGIVHRDLKLENVLLNLPPHTLASLPSPKSHPTSLTTLTDLGLSKRIDPASPLLTTRCGSEDYAAPELLMGLPYDGRSTDAWALGVVLFALMEGRLPFDGSGRGGGGRSRVAHRIARVEWGWGGEPPAEGWVLGREAVEGLLRRRERRVGLDVLEGAEWVRGGVEVEGGLKCVGE